MKRAIDYVEQFINHWNRDIKRTAIILYDGLASDDERDVRSSEYYLKEFDERLEFAAEKIKDIPYVDLEPAAESFFTNLLNFTEDPDSLYPIPVYVSASPEDMATIGLLLHKNGKFEMFEGNDEASDETYALVDKILNPNKGQIIRTVYASHNVDLAEKIRDFGIAPKGLYVSPSRSYASGYWSLDEERVLFSFKVDDSFLRKESEVDWKIVKECEISNFKFV